MNVLDQIKSYLGNGGLFSPELMEHDKVRDLVMACRDEIEILNTALKAARAERDESDAYIKSIWRANLLPRPMAETLRDRLSHTVI